MDIGVKLQACFLHSKTPSKHVIDLKFFSKLSSLGDVCKNIRDVSINNGYIKYIDKLAVITSNKNPIKAESLNNVVDIKKSKFLNVSHNKCKYTPNKLIDLGVKLLIFLGNQYIGLKNKNTPVVVNNKRIISNDILFSLLSDIINYDPNDSANKNLLLNIINKLHVNADNN